MMHLNKEDEDVASLIQKVFLKGGISVILNAKPLQASKTATGKLVQFESNGKKSEIEVDEILVGAGRAPNVEGLNLEAAGVRYEAGKGTGVLVNDKLQTANRNMLHGDICLPTNSPYSRFSCPDIIQMPSSSAVKTERSDHSWCTYTDPEVAHVGLSEAGADQAGIQVKTFVKLLSEVDRAIVDGEEDGFVKIHVKHRSDKIIGATVVPGMPEMISEVACGYGGKIGLGTLANIIHPYPTQAEAIRSWRPV
jgi:pyruvate/2-oxoglutarate dehydrogenase complex dihydrolipoamide dehydrogenase (E3) component